jgi:hypothetical protein
MARAPLSLWPSPLGEGRDIDARFDADGSKVVAQVVVGDARQAESFESAVERLLGLVDAHDRFHSRFLLAVVFDAFQQRPARLGHWDASNFTVLVAWTGSPATTISPRMKSQ